MGDLLLLCPILGLDPAPGLVSSHQGWVENELTKLDEAYFHVRSLRRTTA
jgi:hypothetical protein